MARETLEHGGSGALVTLADGLAVKTASGDGIAKLVAEAKWLQWIHCEIGDTHVRRCFPRVRAMPSLERPVLRLEALRGRSARAAVLAGDGDELLPVLYDAVTFAFDRLPRVTTRRSAWATGEWCARHLERSVQRAVALHPQLAAAESGETLALGHDQPSRQLLDRARSAVAALRPLVSARPAVIHGDLHLGNILVAPPDGGFAFVDPRGGWDGNVTFDPAYDVAKLLHEPAYLRGRVHHASARQHARLAAVAGVSQVLARHACSILEPSDPTIAARATLMTGMHLASVLRLPHTIGYDVASLFASGTSWLTAGLEAVRERKTVADCEPAWTRLCTDPSWPLASSRG